MLVSKQPVTPSSLSTRIASRLLRTSAIRTSPPVHRQTVTITTTEALCSPVLPRRKNSSRHFRNRSSTPPDDATLFTNDAVIAGSHRASTVRIMYERTMYGKLASAFSDSSTSIPWRWNSTTDTSAIWKPACHRPRLHPHRLVAPMPVPLPNTPATISFKNRCISSGLF